MRLVRKSDGGLMDGKRLIVVLLGMEQLHGVR